MTENEGLLSGLSVAITRPPQQGEPLAERLHAAGADTAIIPLLAIAPLDEAAQIEKVRACLQSLSTIDIAIFVSRNAAEQLLQALAAQQQTWPHTIATIAVGSPTADYLKAHGIAAISPARMDSEGMLALPALQAAAGKRCVIFRGVGGRETTAQTLRDRGAWVDYCELYRRVLPPNAAAAWAQWIEDTGTHKWACVNSVETLQNLLQVDARAAARANLSLVVPGPRVTARAQQAGFARVFTAPDATDHQIFQTIMRGYHR